MKELGPQHKHIANESIATSAAIGVFGKAGRSLAQFTPKTFAAKAQSHLTEVNEFCTPY